MIARGRPIPVEGAMIASQIAQGLRQPSSCGRGSPAIAPPAAEGLWQPCSCRRGCGRGPYPARRCLTSRRRGKGPLDDRRPDPVHHAVCSISSHKFLCITIWFHAITAITYVVLTEGRA